MQSLEHVYDAEELVAELQRARQIGSVTWTPLFDGHKLGNWQSSEFGTDGLLEVINGEISIGMGDPLSGITW